MGEVIDRLKWQVPVKVGLKSIQWKCCHSGGRAEYKSQEPSSLTESCSRDGRCVWKTSELQRVHGSAGINAT